jgi:hypothetical protein
MESVNHFKISAVVAPLLVAGLYGVTNPLTFLVLSLYGVMAGVLIDLDHFFWARYNHGHWQHLLDAIEAPFVTATRHTDVISWAVQSRQRYTSHLLILGLAGTVTMTISTELMGLTTGMITLHIFCDLYDSYQTGGWPF